MRLTPRPVTRLNATLLSIIALLAALAPFGTDIYLPTFPAMAAQLGTTATGAQMTLTAFLIGAGLGQLFFGPLSDRVGRRRPLIAGCLVCVVAGIVAASAPNLPVLVGARLLQGLSGAAGMVIGRALIADVAKGRDAAEAYNLTAIVQGIAPVAAPLIGSVFAQLIGWRGLLAIVAGLSVISLVAVVFCVPETHQPAARQAKAAAQAGPSGLASRAYLGNTAALVFGFGAMMAYISASPFVYQVMIGMDELLYGIVFGGTALALTAVSYVSARLVTRVPPHVLLRSGIGIIVAAAAALVLFVAAPVPTWWLVLPLFAGAAAMGLVFGNATALALAAVPHRAGTASALLGAAQFLLGAAVAPLVSLQGDHSATPLAAVFATCAVLALAAYLAAHNGRPRAARSRATASAAAPDAAARPAGATVGAVMKRDVYTLRPDQTVAQAMRLLTDKRISGAPVVNADDRVVGFLSDGDVMRYLSAQTPAFVNEWSFAAETGNPDFAEALDEVMSLTVQDLAHRHVVTLSADDDLGAACKTLTENHFRKVPVCDANGKLVGVLNRSNITRHAVEVYLAKAQ